MIDAVRHRSLLAYLPDASQGEVTEVIERGPGWRLERIVSRGQVSADWYDQAEHEWVMVLAGHAQLEFDAEPVIMELRAGDAVWIPAHRRHRVCWTDPDQRTVWLALFVASDDGAQVVEDHGA